MSADNKNKETVWGGMIAFAVGAVLLIGHFVTGLGDNWLGGGNGGGVRSGPAPDGLALQIEYHDCSMSGGCIASILVDNRKGTRPVEAMGFNLRFYDDQGRMFAAESDGAGTADPGRELRLSDVEVHVSDGVHLTRVAITSDGRTPMATADIDWTAGDMTGM